jgi:hypothetical protein
MDEVEAVLNEIEILIKLKHQNIIKYISYFDENIDEEDEY